MKALHVTAKVLKGILFFPFYLLGQAISPPPPRHIAQGGFIGSLIGAGASLLGGALSSNAADKASNAQLAATNKGVKEMKRQFNIARADEKGYRDEYRKDTANWRRAGNEAVYGLRRLLGIEGQQYLPFGELAKPFEFEKDPGYQFRMDEGQKAIERSAAARGNLLSGKTMKAVGKYGSDYASNEYDRAFGRDMATKTQRYNMLSGLAGYGPQTSPAPNTSERMAHGNNLAQAYMGAGNARAAGVVGSSNAMSGGINAAGNQLSNYYMMKDLLK